LAFGAGSAHEDGDFGGVEHGVEGCER
jgi:hypothetical protein